MKRRNRIMEKELWWKMMSEADSKINLEEWTVSAKSYIERLGKTTMLFKAVEECAELGQAISKCYRLSAAMGVIETPSEELSSEYNISLDNLKEEMGDVVLQIFNICTVFNIDVFDVIRAANVKVTYGNIMIENDTVR